MVSLTA
jgi:predicted XRE-type DNA-binding protein